MLIRSALCRLPWLLLQLANVLSTEALFYTCIIPFIAFFGSFAFVLYPLRDVLHPTGALLADAAPFSRTSSAPLHNSQWYT